jgi:hypothetical protein
MTKFLISPLYNLKHTAYFLFALSITTFSSFSSDDELEQDKEGSSPKAGLERMPSGDSDSTDSGIREAMAAMSTGAVDGDDFDDPKYHTPNQPVRGISKLAAWAGMDLTTLGNTGGDAVPLSVGDAVAGPTSLLFPPPASGLDDRSSIYQTPIWPRGLFGPTAPQKALPPPPRRPTAPMDSSYPLEPRNLSFDFGVPRPPYGPPPPSFQRQPPPRPLLYPGAAGSFDGTGCWRPFAPPLPPRSVLLSPSDEGSLVISINGRGVSSVSFPADPMGHESVIQIQTLSSCGKVLSSVTIPLIVQQAPPKL